MIKKLGIALLLSVFITGIALTQKSAGLGASFLIGSLGYEVNPTQEIERNHLSSGIYGFYDVGEGFFEISLGGMIGKSGLIGNFNTGDFNLLCRIPFFLMRDLLSLYPLFGIGLNIGFPDKVLNFPSARFHLGGGTDIYLGYQQFLRCSVLLSYRLFPPYIYFPLPDGRNVIGISRGFDLIFRAGIGYLW